MAKALETHWPHTGKHIHGDPNFSEYERKAPSGGWKVFEHEERLPLSKERAKGGREALGK